MRVVDLVIDMREIESRTVCRRNRVQLSATGSLH